MERNPQDKHRAHVAVLKAMAGGEKHFQRDLAALPALFVSILLSVLHERENKENILWTGQHGSVFPLLASRGCPVCLPWAAGLSC